MIIHPGDQLELGPVDQEHRPGDIQLIEPERPRYVRPLRVGSPASSSRWILSDAAGPDRGRSTPPVKTEH
jgi:hypothetical protein